MTAVLAAAAFILAVAAAVIWAAYGPQGWQLLAFLGGLFVLVAGPAAAVSAWRSRRGDGDG